MPPVSVLSMLFRISELALSTTLAILAGTFYHSHLVLPSWIRNRFLYTFVVALLGIVSSLLFIINLLSLDISLVYLIDFILFALFIAAFGVLGDFIIPMLCDPIWSWHGVMGLGACGRFKAEVALAFVVGSCFFISGILGIYVARKRNQGGLFQ